MCTSAWGHLTLEVLQQAAVLHQLCDNVDWLLHGAYSIQLDQLWVPQPLHDLSLSQEVLRIHGTWERCSLILRFEEKWTEHWCHLWLIFCWWRGVIIVAILCRPGCTFTRALLVLHIQFVFQTRNGSCLHYCQMKLIFLNFKIWPIKP